MKFESQRREKMDETHYSISETGKMVGVESHVLRYWEEELELNIPRNGKSHRYYTDLHIRLFQKVKELKEKGYQLKAIEQVLKRMMDGGMDVDPDEVLEQVAVDTLANVDESSLPVLSQEEKMDQFQKIMSHIVGQAMQVNNQAIVDDVSRQVNDRVIQELEYMMRVNNEKEEERFKQLDETLRAYQKEGKGRAEVAATKIPFFKKKKFGRSGKKL